MKSAADANNAYTYLYLSTIEEKKAAVDFLEQYVLGHVTNKLMPAEKAMPLEETLELLRQYDFTHQRRCSFEYICFGGLNDTPTYGREIARLLQGLECRVNLIRFHEIPGVDLPASDEKRMESLRDYLTAHGVFTTIRASRGQDIFAACGLLSTAKIRNNNEKQNQ